MLGALIQAERRRRGWSQRELGRRAGLTQPKISGIERGGRPWVPSLVLVRLAAALELPVEDLERAAGPQLRR